MRVKTSFAVAAVAALSVPVLAHAGGKVDKATGGGQILVANQGAGSTLAFNAKGTSTNAQGQLQYIDRSAGTGHSQVKHHGTVTCIDAMMNTAKIAGVLRNGDSFNLYVEDHGEGNNAGDMVWIDTMADTPDCEFDTPDMDELEALGRGNVQVYDADMAAAMNKAKSAAKKTRVMSYRTALRLGGFRP